MQIRVMEPPAFTARHLLSRRFRDRPAEAGASTIKGPGHHPDHCRERSPSLQEAMRGGVFDYILKPVVFPRFEQTLKRYRNHRLKFQSLESLEQSDIDRIIHKESPEASRRAELQLPKGIDPVTLDKIILEMNREKGGFTSEEMAERVGASRTTARRYLEYLVSRGSLKSMSVTGGWKARTDLQGQFLKFHPSSSGFLPSNSKEIQAGSVLCFFLLVFAPRHGPGFPQERDKQKVPWPEAEQIQVRQKSLPLHRRCSSQFRCFFQRLSCL